MKEKVWILTSSYNLYDQQGDYFEAAFKEKPTAEAIAKWFEKKGEKITEELAQHIANGGDRQDTEHQWYNLIEEELN